MKFTILWKWFDFWMGAYWDAGHRTLYVCPLPTLVLRFELDGAKDESRHRTDRLHNSELSSGGPADKRQQTEQAVRSTAWFGFGDALRIARGCTDYGGGHHNDGHMDAYQHGIQTVINALEAAEKAGLNELQVRMLWRMGAEKPNDPAHRPGRKSQA